MPESATYSNRAKYYDTPRALRWISETYFYGPACSRCAWLFRPTGPPTGISLQQMKEDYTRRCNGEFAAHVCAEHPRAAKTNVSSNQSSRSRDTEGRPAHTKLQSGISESYKTGGN
jgi:hypothetical protein